MIAYANGTPFEHGYADFPNVKIKFGELVVERFFETHSLEVHPAEWR
jgi:hypothetical protein